MNKQTKIAIVLVIGITISLSIGDVKASTLNQTNNTITPPVNDTNPIPSPPIIIQPPPVKNLPKIQIIPSNSNIIIDDTKIVTTGPTNQIKWGYETHNNYFSTQMELNSQYPELVKTLQPFNGIMTTVSISPIINTLKQPANLILYNNGVPTGNIITIPPGINDGIILSINYPFVKGDNLEWKLDTTSTDVNSLLLNEQVLINYNG